MIVGALATGALAACVVTAIRFLQNQFSFGASWAAPILLIVLAVFASWIRFVLKKWKKAGGEFHGVTDMLVQIHDPGVVDSPVRWSTRALISALLSLISGAVGPEGAAAEATYSAEMGTRSRSARWFEQRRRTAAANSLAAAIAAAFGAPFAATLLPIELGIGGRTIASVISALSVFVVSKFLATLVPIRKFEIGGALYDVSLTGWKIWAAIVAVSIAGAVLGVLLVRFIRYCDRGLTLAVGRQVFARICLGGILAALVLVSYSRAVVPSQDLFQDLFWNRVPIAEAGLLFLSKAMLFGVLVSAFGTSAIFWAIFALGGFFGFAASQPLAMLAPDLTGLAAVSALVGATSFWAAALGAPFAGAVLAYEMTGNLRILVPCIFAGWLARELARLMRTRSLPEEQLLGRGIRLLGGRSAEILDSIFVRDAMVTDFETVRENESVGDLHQRLIRSRYPFVPVLKIDGTYAGLLTIDALQGRIESELRIEGAHTGKSAARWLEVKDLLYRSSSNTPVVGADDPISSAQRLLDGAPCVAVLSGDRKLVGLLFVQNVRLAYEHAVVRRSLH